MSVDAEWVAIAFTALSVAASFGALRARVRALEDARRRDEAIERKVLTSMFPRMVDSVAEMRGRLESKHDE